MPQGIDASFQVDPRKLAEFIRSPRGPVFREMAEAGDIVVKEAKRLVGYSRPDPLGRPRSKPNHLRDTIVKRVQVDGGVPVVWIGSNDPIALLHHEGTVPHVIAARNAPLLVFWWDRVGAIVRTPQVNHPGTKPNRYLTNAMRALRSRY